MPSDPSPVYSYRIDGKFKVSQEPPPVGTEFTLTQGGVVIDNGVVGRLSTRQQEALARKQQDAVQQAKNDALVKAQKAEAQKLARARTEVDHARMRLEGAGYWLKAWQDGLSAGLRELNESLAERDRVQDWLGVGLAGASVIVAIVASGGTALVIGLALTGAGWINSSRRVENPDEAENPWPDRAGKFNDAVNTGDDALEVIGKEGRWLGKASEKLGVAGAGAGFVSAGYEALSTSAASVTSWQVYDSGQLSRTYERLGELGKQEDMFFQSKLPEGQIRRLQDQVKETLRQQRAFNDAMKDFIAKNKIYCDLLTTYSEPR